MKTRLPVVLPVAILSVLVLAPAGSALPDMPVCAQQCQTPLDPNSFGMGIAAAISGDTIAVGDLNDGSVHIFVKNVAGLWEDQAVLTGSVANDFGAAIALDGDTLVVGSPAANNFRGRAHVYVRTGTTWSEQATLTVSSLAQGDNFAATAAIKGDSVIIGTANFDFSHGAAYIFTRSGTTWTFQQELLPQGSFPQDASFGIGVAIGTNRAVVVGDPHSYIFVRNGTHWSQEHRANTPGAGFGPAACDLEGRTALVAYKILHRSTHGWELAADVVNGPSGQLSGDTLVVGAPFEGANETGQVHIYHRDAGVWSEQAILQPPDGQNGAGFGWAVGISSCTIVVGSFDPHFVPGVERPWVFEPTTCVQ